MDAYQFDIGFCTILPPAGERIPKNLQPRLDPRVRVVRRHLWVDQVHLAIGHLPAPVLLGQEAGQAEGPGAAPHLEGDSPRSN